MDPLSTNVSPAASTLYLQISYTSPIEFDCGRHQMGERAIGEGEGFRRQTEIKTADCCRPKNATSSGRRRNTPASVHS